MTACPDLEPRPALHTSMMAALAYSFSSRDQVLEVTGGEEDKAT